MSCAKFSNPARFHRERSRFSGNDCYGAGFIFSEANQGFVDVRTQIEETSKNNSIKTIDIFDAFYTLAP